MKQFLKNHGWYSFMLIGIGLMISTLMVGETFIGQSILASILIIISLVLEGTRK